MLVVVSDRIYLSKLVGSDCVSFGCHFEMKVEGSWFRLLPALDPG